MGRPPGLMIDGAWSGRHSSSGSLGDCWVKPEGRGSRNPSPQPLGREWGASCRQIQLSSSGLIPSAHNSTGWILPAILQAAPFFKSTPGNSILWGNGSFLELPEIFQCEISDGPTD